MTGKAAKGPFGSWGHRTMAEVDAARRLNKTLDAIDLLRAGKPVREVAKLVGATVESVRRIEATMAKPGAA